MLARKIDAGWEAVAPMELRFAAQATKGRPFVIHKRNYLGEEDAYGVDYFRHAPQNLNVADINNHITAEYVAVTTAGYGMAVAMNTNVKANFAFCPLQMQYLPQRNAFEIRANPFGTYYGHQIFPPTRGNRLGYEAVLLSAPQLHSAGPTYNGAQDRFELMVAFFEGDTLPDAVKQDLIAFACPPFTIATQSVEKPQQEHPSLLPPAGFLALAHQNGILFRWEPAGPPGTQYCIRYHAASGSEEKTHSTTARTLFIDASEFSAKERLFIATVEAQYPDGRQSKPSPEIRFRLTPPPDPALEIPLEFKAKMVWASVSAWLRQNLL